MDNALLFATLFRKYLDNNCSREEVDQLMVFLKDDAYKQYADELIEMQLVAPMDTRRPVDSTLRERLEFRLQFILETEEPAVPVYKLHFLRRNRWWLAAAVMLLLGTGAYWWLKRSPRTPEAVLVQEKSGDQLKNDVMPGGNKAVLTLANGATIILDNAANGTLAQQGNARVVKLNDGQLSYDQSAQNAGNPLTTHHSPLTYNTLTTPRGGQYQLVLPDGSKVWLNAASSIRYPTVFAGNERRVEITGEAYFEITKNAAMPFRVIFPLYQGAPGGASREGAIEVLGTHFNINAYDDEEAIKTTLLEGKVKITKDAASVILNPNQQASIPYSSQSSQSSRSIPVKTVDVEEVMAWKNGAFQFAGAGIQAVMRQISRWYDVEVEYKGNISLHFAGTMSRNVNISQVIEMLERAGGIKIIVNGKKITVMP